MQIVIFKNGGKIVKTAKKVGNICLLRYLWISLLSIRILEKTAACQSNQERENHGKTKKILCFSRCGS